jgi:hypothetical protein
MSMRSFFGGADGDEAISEFNALSKLMEYNVTVTTNLGEVIDLDLSKYER